MAMYNSVFACLICTVLGSSLTMLYMRAKSTNNYLLQGPERKTDENIQNDGDTFIDQNTSQSIKGIKLVTLRNAVKVGAVCLDGSPPAYYVKKGHDRGSNKWIINFAGGAWCYDEEACYQRSFTTLGSTDYPLKSYPNEGMYSNDSKINPDFYNWNMIFVVYCDGSSFTGLRTNPVYFKEKAVYFRGKLILDFIIKDLIKRGLGKAQDLILTGSSAGSLAVLFHADYIKSLLPGTKVYAIPDSGYFINIKTFYGSYALKEMFTSVMKTHNSTSALHPECIKQTASEDHWKCMFPQYFINFIQTPVFILQSAYDIWQIKSSLHIVCSIPNYRILGVLKNLTYLSHDSLENLHTSILFKTLSARAVQVSSRSLPVKDGPVKPKLVPWRWQSLYSNPAECTRTEMNAIVSIREITVDALAPVLKKRGAGLFLSPCFEHTQARYDSVWNKVKIRGKTMRQAISEWFMKKPGNHLYIGEHLKFDTCVS